MTEPQGEVASGAEPLVRKIYELLLSTPLPERFLEDWPAPEAARQTIRQRLPVLAWLNELVDLGTPTLSPLLKAIGSTADELEWRQTYTAEDFGPAFLDRYGWTELIGQRGPVASIKMACGILLLGPDTHYPAHAHEAEEIYVCLSGAASWMRGGEPFSRKSAGMVIHHPSWMPHAIRTNSEPVMALYVWRGGDLAAKSKIIHPSVTDGSGTDGWTRDRKPT